MLTIKLKKAPRKPNTFDIKADAANKYAEGFCIELRKNLKEYRCDSHPEKESVITVRSTPKGADMFEIIKDFCCDEFARNVEARWK